jgi:hypothetical protein
MVDVAKDQERVNISVWLMDHRTVQDGVDLYDQHQSVYGGHRPGYVSRMQSDSLLRDHAPKPYTDEPYTEKQAEEMRAKAEEARAAQGERLANAWRTPSVGIPLPPIAAAKLDVPPKRDEQSHAMIGSSSQASQDDRSAIDAAWEARGQRQVDAWKNPPSLLGNLPPVGRPLVQPSESFDSTTGGEF